MKYDYKCRDCGAEEVLNHSPDLLGSAFKCGACGGPLGRFISTAPTFAGPKTKPNSHAVWETSSAKRARWKREGK